MGRISIGKEISSLARQVRMLRNRCLKEAGCAVSAAHFHVFVYIARNEGCTEKQVAQAIGSDKTLVAKAVKKLTHQGLAFCRRDDEDARFKRVWPTPQGIAEMEKVGRALRRITDILSQGIDEAQTKQFLQTLEKMQQNVSESLE